MNKNLPNDSSYKVSNLQHLGIILDGNRRWARQRKLSALKGHDEGLNKVEDVLRAAADAGIKFVSLFIFSTDNWKRKQNEVSHLMRLFVSFIHKEGQRLVDEGVCFKLAGRIDDKLSGEVKEAIEHITNISAHNTKFTVVLCFNYGGHNEILDMVKAIASKQLKPQEITLLTLQENLYNPEVPELDLIIRTSGERRISGFQLWRASYAEMLYIDKYWPDFTRDDLHEAFKFYDQRQRRFGGD